MLNFITDSVGRGGCQEGRRKGVAGCAMKKKGNSAKIKKKRRTPQNEIKMSAALSHTLNIKDNCVKYAWLDGMLRTILSCKLYL